MCCPVRPALSKVPLLMSTSPRRCTALFLFRLWRDALPWAPRDHSTAFPPETRTVVRHLLINRSRLICHSCLFWPDLYLAASVRADPRAKGAMGTRSRIQRPRAKGRLYASDEEDLLNEPWSDLIDFSKHFQSHSKLVCESKSNALLARVEGDVCKLLLL